LTAAMGSSDWATAKTISHNMKGILPLFCHTALAECLVDFYSTLTTEESLDSTTKKFHILRPSLEKFESELRNWCAKQV
jgi:hypothetical protein